MAKRRKVGLIYQYNENWIGGTYYIENLISALNILPDKQKPELILFTEDEAHYVNLQKKISYPYYSRREYNKNLGVAERIINKCCRLIVGRNYFTIFHTDVDVVFPAGYLERFKPGQVFLFWKPDFQEHFLPDFFDAAEIKDRKDYQDFINNNAKYIVFSSETVKAHFNQLYPFNKLKQFVIRFAVTHSATQITEDVLKKYAVTKPFFLCCNQFWKHKNHHVILDALKLLKEKGIETDVVFTGKNHDYRHPEYFNELVEISKQYGLQENLKFLGFIDRDDQLALMKYSVAVIQPSLFEGWSTVIEDAKALNVFVLSSAIDVHKEQLQHYKASILFAATDGADLAEKMENIETYRPSGYQYLYKQDVEKFADAFSGALEEIYSSEQKKGEL